MRQILAAMGGILANFHCSQVVPMALNALPIRMTWKSYRLKAILRALSCQDDGECN
jgi:hypothetical protein